MWLLSIPSNKSQPNRTNNRIFEIFHYYQLFHLKSYRLPRSWPTIFIFLYSIYCFIQFRLISLRSCGWSIISHCKCHILNTWSISQYVRTCQSSVSWSYPLCYYGLFCTLELFTCLQTIETRRWYMQRDYIVILP